MSGYSLELLQTRDPFKIYTFLNYGPLSLFAGAVFASDSLAKHLTGPVFHVALMIKVLYPLISACLSIILLSSQLRSWVAFWACIRIAITIPWLCVIFLEFQQWKRALPAEVEDIHFSEGEIDDNESEDSEDDDAEISGLDDIDNKLVSDILKFQESTEELRDT